MTRNLVSEENAEHNRMTPGGGYTFNAFPPEDYEGRLLVFAVVRLGDHAHVTVETAWQAPTPSHRDPRHERPPTLHHSTAGKLVMQWADWLHWRSELDEKTIHRIAEVENPTHGQLDRYAA